MGHWYDQEGSPRHEVSGKNGIRATNLRDARKNGWIPSVSTVWSDVVSKPMLTRWKENNLMKYMHIVSNLSDNQTYTNNPASIDALSKEARAAFSVHQKELTDRGINAHQSLSIYFNSLGADVVDLGNHALMIRNVVAKLDQLCGRQNWESEKSFANSYGYGGQVDLCSDEFVIDFKTKDMSKGADVKKMVFDDHGVQLAAYDTGLGDSGRRLINLYIDVESGNVLEFEHEDTERYWNMFKHALELWKLIKKYDPKWYPEMGPKDNGLSSLQYAKMK
jgi:hypothetical protein